MITRSLLGVIIGTVFIAGSGSILHSNSGPDEIDGSQLTESRIAQLVKDLSLEDRTIGQRALRELKQSPDETIPFLFKRLRSDDWNSKAETHSILFGLAMAQQEDGYRLDFLNEILRFAKAKLGSDLEAERVWAAILLRHLGGTEDAAVIEALLEAIGSPDKNLRLLGSLLLLYQPMLMGNPDFTQWFGQVIPALISSFDQPLVFNLFREESGVLMYLAGSHLDRLIGDEPYFSAVLAEKMSRIQGHHTTGMTFTELREGTQAVKLFAETNKSDIEKVRARWVGWWEKHKGSSAAELGKLIIERNLALLADERAHVRACAEDSLSSWAGSKYFYLGKTDDWNRWWEKHRDTYAGPTDTK